MSSQASEGILYQIEYLFTILNSNSIKITLNRVYVQVRLQEWYEVYCCLGQIA